jgi:P pilus assembly chaperone PapD
MKKAVSILLALLVLGTVVLFAATTDGVEWNYSESRGVTTLRNTTSNDLYVTVWVANGRPYSGGNGFLAAGATKEISAQVTSIRASRIKVATKW